MCRLHHAKCQTDEAQAEIKISGRNINNLRYADDITLMAESKEELKSLLTKVKQESEKASLKLNIQKRRSQHPVPSLHGKQMGKLETVTDFIFLDSKVSADGDCKHEIKRCLLQTMTNLDSILKNRDITLLYYTLLTKVCIVKAMVFQVVMYRYKSCTIKKAEHQRIDAFELWCQRRLLRVP